MRIFYARPNEHSGKDPEYATRISYPICPKKASVDCAEWTGERTDEKIH